MDETTTAPAPGQAAQWRPFLRALAEEVDSLSGPGERDDMLRGVGRRLSRMMPLPAVNSLPALEMEINDALAAIGWGTVQLELDEAEAVLRVIHTGLPRVGSLGSPAGQWLSAMLEGLYDGWFAQQPGNQPSLSSLRTQGSAGPVTILHYARQ